MNSKIEDYKSMKYKIEITPIPEEEGGGYEAYIPDLGRYTVCATGDTVEEAINNLNEVKSNHLERWIKENKRIPVPKQEDNRFGGKIALRIPKSLHEEIYNHAKKEGISINSYISHCLTTGISFNAYQKTLHEFLHKYKQDMNTNFKIEFSINLNDSCLLEPLQQNDETDIYQLVA